MPGRYSFLLGAGERPRWDTCAQFLSTVDPGGGQAACVSHQPPEEEGWIELLSSGLTFELSGLSPASAAGLPPAGHFYGLPEQTTRFALEAICLAPGAHIAAGAHSLPVVRVMSGLAVRLATLPGVKAVCWHPAGTWMAPDYFARIGTAWLAGGSFPALGLTALESLHNGGVKSRGLSHFIGQEICLAPGLHAEPAAMIKLAVRIIDRLIATGKLSAPLTIDDIEARQLRLEPGPSGDCVLVSVSGG